MVISMGTMCEKSGVRQDLAAKIDLIENGWRRCSRFWLDIMATTIVHKFDSEYGKPFQINPFIKLYILRVVFIITFT